MKTIALLTALFVASPALATIQSYDLAVSTLYSGQGAEHMGSTLGNNSVTWGPTTVSAKLGYNAQHGGSIRLVVRSGYNPADQYDIGIASADLQYTFTVNARTAAAAAALASANNPLSVMGHYSFQFARNVGDVFGQVSANGVFMHYCDNGFGCDSGTFAFNVGGTASGNIYSGTIDLSARLSQTIASPGPVRRSSEMIDPVISIDPSVLSNVGDYTITVEPGGGGSVPTPEPASLGLLAAAAISFAAARRRRA